MLVNGGDHRAETAPGMNHFVAFFRLQLGLFIFALSIVMMLGAGIGLDPWSAVHEGLTLRTVLSFGRITQLVGLALVVVSWVFLRVRPGLGTLCNMVLIGIWVDWLLARDVIPVHSMPSVAAFGQFLFGIAVNGFATALYIGARYGAGPRDGFILGLSHRLGTTIRATRVGIEITLLVTAFVLGGSIGWGTLLFALLMGPAMQAALRLLRVSSDPHAPRRPSRRQSGYAENLRR